MKKGILFVFTLFSLISMNAEKRAYHIYHDIGFAKFVSIYPDNAPWILTNSKILLRYENNQWKTVAHNHKIDFNTLKVDAQNKVWAMKHYGNQLYFLKNNTWDSIAFNDSMHQAISFNIDRKGNPFIVSQSGIWRYEAEKFIRILYKNADTTLYYFDDIFFDKMNNWYVKIGNTIIKNPQKNPVKWDYPNVGFFRGMDRQNNIYFANSNKISIYQNAGLIKEINLPISFTSNAIWMNHPDDIYFLAPKYQLHYNGSNFTVDSNLKGITNGMGYIDYDGHFWKSTSKGIVIKKGDTIKNTKPHDLGLRSEKIADVAKFGQDYLITYYDSLPTLFSQGKYYHYDSLYTISPLKNVITNSNNEYWANGKDTLYDYKHRRWEKYKLDGGSVYVNTLCKTNSGGVALFSYDKFIRIDSGIATTVPFPFKPFLSKAGGDCSIIESKNDVFWLGIFQQGIYKYEDGIWTEFCDENTPGFPVSISLGMAVDSSSNVYTACLSSGLLRYNGSGFELFDTANSNAHYQSKISVSVDHENKVWCGDYEKGMEYFDGSSFHILNIDYNQQIYRTWVDENNDKWFISNGLISIYNEKDEPTPPIPPITPMSEIISFYPNPTSESITIQNLLADDRIQLFDLTGRKLVDYYSGKEGNEVMNLTSLNRGLYLMNIYRKKQAYFQAKVLKE